jgi:hypothetical protein
MGYVALFSVALGVLRFIAWGVNAIWGKSARLDAKISYLDTQKALAKAERTRVLEAYKKIDEAKPPASDQELQDKINDAWNKK